MAKDKKKKLVEGRDSSKVLKVMRDELNSKMDRILDMDDIINDVDDTPVDKNKEVEK